MLTRKQILRAARLMHQTGESPPGYLDDAACFAGPFPPHETISLPRHSRKGIDQRKKETIVEVSIDIAEDPETGEMHIVRKP